MAKSKYTDLICVAIIALLLAVTLLFHFGEELGMEKVERDPGSGSLSYAAVITLSDNGSSIHGSGAYESGSGVVIAHGGEYTLTGSLSDGQLVVEAESGAEVRLILDGVNVRCGSGPALWIKNAGRTVVELANGSENHLGSGPVFSGDALTLEAEGALHSEDDLALTGSGVLAIVNQYSHGIVCKDALLLESGSYDVDAVGHGIRGRDSVEILGGEYVIRADKDGIQSNNDTDPALGMVTIRDGSLQIEAGQDGIQAETALRINGGRFHILSGRGSSNSVYAPGVLPWKGADAALSDSAKGLKAGTELYIGSGSFELDCEDDALHSGGSLRVEGGELSIRSGDDALHGDVSLTVAGGSLRILDAQEGLEAPQLSIQGGEVDITCRNDGLNANGENSPLLSISGGVLRLCCQGDGLDSNGDLHVSGGEIYVSAQPSDGNSALDYAAEHGGSALMDGGTLIACGFGGMAESFSQDSRQGSFLIHLEETASGGTELVLKDSSGQVLLRYAPEQDYNAVLLSCPALQLGESYSFSAGDQRLSLSLTDRATVSGSAVHSFGGMRPPMGDMQPPPPAAKRIGP
ncbi:MAG: carbohydrate-binding domain-containing protein [Oscillospiraceae bacterium]|nr:carbohydrate-binding domain-containing protein [Oscillospiraceae bacterium]